VTSFLRIGRNFFVSSAPFFLVFFLIQHKWTPKVFLQVECPTVSSRSSTAFCSELCQLLLRRLGLLSLTA
jgi:hypothetical protein